MCSLHPEKLLLVLLLVLLLLCTWGLSGNLSGKQLPVPKVEHQGHRPSTTAPAHLAMALVLRGPPGPSRGSREGRLPPPLLYCYRNFVPLVPEVLGQVIPLQRMKRETR